MAEVTLRLPCAQVTVSVPDDMDVDLDITLSEGDTLVVATGPDSTSVFNADFAGVPSTNPTDPVHHLHACSLACA